MQEKLIFFVFYVMSWDGIVSLVNCYGLGGLGIESR